MQENPSPFDQQLLALCREGKKIAAIKLYKDRTRQPLKASKDYVDQLMLAHGVEAPETGGGCFVATACYGDYDAPEVLILRQFRDQQLLTNKPGRMLVRAYYAVSPPLARRLAATPAARNAVRRFFIQPLIHLLS